MTFMSELPRMRNSTFIRKKKMKTDLGIGFVEIIGDHMYL